MNAIRCSPNSLNNNPKMEVNMLKTLMIVSLTAFAAVAAIAAPRNVDIPVAPSPNEEVAVNPSDDQGAVTNLTRPVDEKVQGCGCGNKPKKGKR